MKGKRVGKREATTMKTELCVIDEETEVLGVKPFRRPPRGN